MNDSVRRSTKTLRNILCTLPLVLFTLMSTAAWAAEPPPPPMLAETWGCTYKSGKDMEDVLKARDYMVSQAEKAGLSLTDSYLWSLIKGNIPSRRSGSTSTRTSLPTRPPATPGRPAVSAKRCWTGSMLCPVVRRGLRPCAPFSVGKGCRMRIRITSFRPAAASEKGRVPVTCRIWPARERSDDGNG